MAIAPTHPDLAASLLEPKLLGPLSPDILLATYAQVNGDFEAFRAKLTLTAAQLLFFIEDNAFAERRVVIDAFLTRATARRYQTIAAEALTKAIKSTDDPIESRRAGSALARMVRFWDCFDPASPTAPIRRAVPPPREPPPEPPPEPPEPLITMEPQFAEHPVKAVDRAMCLYQSPRMFSPQRRAERVAVQLAPGATLDHKFLPPQAFLDPSVMAEIAQDSTLADLKDTGE